jgi:hypothetical protein
LSLPKLLPVIAPTAPKPSRSATHIFAGRLAPGPKYRHHVARRAGLKPVPGPKYPLRGARGGLETRAKSEVPPLRGARGLA